MCALAEQCGPQDSTGGVLDQGNDSAANYRRNMSAFSHLPTLGNHATPQQIKTIMSLLWGDKLWQQYLKVTIVRNPWERAVSFFDYKNNALKKQISFEESLLNTERPYWFYDDGSPTADVYLRYENLDSDYQALCERLNLEYKPLPVMRKGQRDHKKPYWEYYDAQTQEIIAQEFEQEIAYFGYKFAA